MLVVQGRPHGKSLRFPRGEFVFGRGPECHVRPNSPSVSRQHCLLRVTAEGVLIRDLASTNGTLVNGTRLVGERPLTDGDLVQLGPLVLQLRCPRRSETVTECRASSDTAEIVARGS
jgi:pSer/pThr/pTyr-binding forkhead associated (FHA) protein